MRRFRGKGGRSHGAGAGAGVTSFHFRALDLMLRAEIQLKVCSPLLIAISKGIFQYFRNISAKAGAQLNTSSFFNYRF